MGSCHCVFIFMAAVTNCQNLVVKTKQISYLVVLEVSGPKVNVLARLHPTGGSRGESNSFPSSDSRSYLHSLVSGLFFHLQIQQFNIFQSHSHPNLPPFYEPNGKNIQSVPSCQNIIILEGKRRPLTLSRSASFCTSVAGFLHHQLLWAGH